MDVYWLEPWQYADEGVVINWLAPESSASVAVGPAGSTLTTYTSDNPPQIPGGTDYVHRVVLTTLSPDTVYDFDFGDASGVRQFRTLPATKTRDIHIAQGSDHQAPASIDDPAFRSINGHIAAEEPDIFVMNGDHVADEGGTGAGGAPEWKQYLGFLQTDIFDATTYAPLCIATIGNHDVNPHSLTQSVTGTEPDDPPIYLETLFHCLWDETVARYHGSYGYITAGDWLLLLGMDNGFKQRWEDQTTWLQNLEVEHGDSFDHTLILQHMPPFPVSRDFDMVGQELYKPQVIEAREKWHPIYQSMGANWVMHAHEHVYALTPSINIPKDHGGISRTDSQYVETDDPPLGIRYTGGGPWHSNTGPRVANNATEWWIETYLEQTNYPTVTLQADAETGSAYDEARTVIVDGERMSLNSVYWRDSDTVTLAPDESYTGTLTWNTATGDAGTWDATVSSDNDSDVLAVEITPKTLAGTVTLNGTGVGGATVHIINTLPNPSEHVATLTTASDGSFSHDVTVDGDFHVVTQYDDGAGSQYNALTHHSIS